MSSEIQTDALEQIDRDERGRFVRGGPFGWQPGQSGFAGGRHDSLLDHLRRLGGETLEDGRTRNQALAQALWDLALGKGSLRIRLAATEQILDRMHGRPSQSVKVGIGAEQPTEIELRSEIQARLVDRGLSIEESDRFLLAIGATE